MSSLLTKIARMENLLFQPPKEVERVELSIESDWQTWLQSVGPRTFTRPFAPFHHELWDWYWRVTEKRRRGESLTEEEMVFLALWFRGAGKSSMVEWCCLAEGALAGEGYVLYVSGTQSLAEEHVSAIRERLESEEVSLYYPHLANPKVGRHGNQFGWRQDFLTTSGGWAVRPVGLDVGVRGGKTGDMRPTLIVIDDCDEISDSPHVVQKKLDVISRSILPAGTKDTVILFAQNLIHRNSVANLVYTRKTDVLARRITSGPFKAFDDPVIEKQGERNVIISGTPTWPDIDMVAVQKFLDDSGLDAFLAEYQHDFAASEQGRVIPEYDESLHVITWSSFARMFGSRYVPAHWNVMVGHDVGFTEGHLSAWTWIATSAANTRLPGKLFRYRGLTFKEPLVDDMAIEVKRIMGPDPTVGKEHDEAAQIKGWYMSHEAKSERDTYRIKYKMPFAPCDPRKTAGIAQWRHFLRVDKRQPHPFKEDTRAEDGTWTLGSPSWFDVVADDQLETPRDDRGLKIHREQTLAWRWKPTPISDAGMSRDEPVKAFEDTCDATRVILATGSFGPLQQPKTAVEKREDSLPDHLKEITIKELPIEEQHQVMITRDLLVRIHDEQKKKQKEQRRAGLPSIPRMPKLPRPPGR